MVSGFTAMRAMSWHTFKFDANVKQPMVLRPTRAGLPRRAILAAMKCIGGLPTRWFKGQLTLDCNERVVEIPFMLQNIVPVEGMKILDFGCSESLLPIYYAVQGAEVVGVDLRDYEFEHPCFSFRKGDILENDFADGTFDAVVAVSSVEHCGLDVYGSRTFDAGDVRVMEELRRVLKPNGLLALSVPFGSRRVIKEQRIYDSSQLDELIGELAVRRREFFRKAQDGAYWFKCPEEIAGLAGYDPVTGVQGVALLLCQKPG